MIAVRKILVPIDFSKTSTRVLDFGRMLADACGASLHLLHVTGHPLERPETMSRAGRDGCRRLEALLDRADREGRRATTCCLVGAPAAEIICDAADNAIDLIVMGTHSHSPTFQMATGSIPEAVIGLAPCAVLAVKGVDKGFREMAFDSFAATTNPC